jgi:hypothetical protein
LKFHCTDIAFALDRNAEHPVVPWKWGGEDIILVLANFIRSQRFSKRQVSFNFQLLGWVAERLKAAVLKTYNDRSEVPEKFIFAGVLRREMREQTQKTRLQSAR